MPIQTFLVAQRAADFLSIQLDPTFGRFAQDNLQRLYVADLQHGEAGFHRTQGKLNGTKKGTSGVW